MKRQRHLNQLLWGTSTVLLFLAALSLPPRWLESRETLDFDVVAQCLPHSAINHPEAMRLRFANTSTRQGTVLDAFLSVDGAPELGTGMHRWDFPDEGWLSVLFEGPTVESELYCQDTTARKGLELSYYPQEKTRIFLARAAEFSQEELAGMDDASATVLEMNAEGPHGNRYRAGQGSSTPYWLQFSVPVHSQGSVETAIRYELQ